MENGNYNECRMTVKQDKDMRQIKDNLIQANLVKDPSLECCVYNQDEEIEDEKLVKDVFETGDVVTLYIGEMPTAKGITRHNKDWNSLRSLNNESGVDVMLILRTKITGVKTSFDEEKWDMIDFSRWRNDVEICW